MWMEIPASAISGRVKRQASGLFAALRYVMIPHVQGQTQLPASSPGLGAAGDAPGFG